MKEEQKDPGKVFWVEVLKVFYLSGQGLGLMPYNMDKPFSEGIKDLLHEAVKKPYTFEYAFEMVLPKGDHYTITVSYDKIRLKVHSELLYIDSMRIMKALLDTFRGFRELSVKS